VKDLAKVVLALLACLSLVGFAACGDDDEESSGGGAAVENADSLTGSIAIDGSSTVQPFAEAAAELFNEEAPEVQITVGGAGTGDGMEKFCRGEIPIADASRPIEAEEKQACKEENITPVEVRVANDGVAVVTSPSLEIDCLTTDQLKDLLGPDATATNYSDVDPKLPDAEVSLYTPGEESGTFDFFTEAVLETDAEQRRENVQTSADDNVLVRGVTGEDNALGYFGFSFAEENKSDLNIVKVDGGEGCVEPTLEAIQNEEYKPLARPLFMYATTDTIKKPEVKAFLDFTVENQQRIAEASGIVPLTTEQQDETRQKLTQAEGG
jgi:phosphate transport system substrate-binding protein